MAEAGPDPVKLFQSQAEMREFFAAERNSSFFYLTYPEYCQIFGFQPDSRYLAQINKRILYGHLDFFNQSYDSLWLYKWAPLLMKFAFNSGFLPGLGISS